MAELDLEHRAVRALERLAAVHAPMRIPAHQTDPDVVISDLLDEVHRLRAESARARDLVLVELEISVGLWRDPGIKHNFYIAKSLCEFEELIRGEAFEEAARLLEVEPFLTRAAERIRALKELPVSPATSTAATVPTEPVIVKCPTCTRIGPMEMPAGKPIGFCAQCWLGEGRRVPLVVVSPARGGA